MFNILLGATLSYFCYSMISAVSEENSINQTLSDMSTVLEENGKGAPTEEQLRGVIDLFSFLSHMMPGVRKKVNDSKTSNIELKNDGNMGFDIKTVEVR